MTGLMRKRDSSGAIITPQSLGGYQPEIPDGQLRRGLEISIVCNGLWA